MRVHIPSSPAASAAGSQDAFRKPCAATRTEAPMDIWSKDGRSMGALRSNMVSKCFEHKRLRPMETDGDRGTTVA